MYGKNVCSSKRALCCSGARLLAVNRPSKVPIECRGLHCRNKQPALLKRFFILCSLFYAYLLKRTPSAECPIRKADIWNSYNERGTVRHSNRKNSHSNKRSQSISISLACCSSFWRVCSFDTCSNVNKETPSWSSCKKGRITRLLKQKYERSDYDAKKR